MDFTCEKKELQNGIAAVEKIVTTRSTLPIIGNILFEVSKSGIKLSANNLEMGIELKVPAKVIKEGAALLPAKTLTGIVAKLPNATISFIMGEEGRIRISYGESHFNIHSLPPDEFPVLPKVKGQTEFSIGPEIFASMIRQTIFSVSESEDKYVLTGGLLEYGKGATGDSSTIRLIATDGYRLAKRAEKIKLEGIKPGKVIVPAKTLQELLRILDMKKDEDELKITIAHDQIAFRLGDAYLVSRLIQGAFPDYKQVIPKKSTTKIILEKKSFQEAAERSAIIAQGSANIVRLEIKGKKLQLTANTPDVGAIQELVEADVKGGSKAQVAFNIRLITDMLKVVSSDKVILELTEALGPGQIRQDGESDYLYIVMPIRTQEVG